MKVTGSSLPDSIWIQYVENGIAHIRLRKDIVATQTTNANGDLQNIWEYDEIQMELSERDNLHDYIQENFELLYELALTKYKQMKIEELDRKCNETILSGFSSSALGVNHQYDFDYEAQQNLSGMLTLFNTDATTTQIDWKTLDAGVLTHTKEQFLALYRDGFVHKNQNITKYWNLKEQVKAATTLDAITEIIW